MKSLYLECKMGAAGDMLCAALYELCDTNTQQAFLSKMNALGLPHVQVSTVPEEKCGIVGTRMVVTIHHSEEESQDHDHPHEGHTHSHEHSHNHGDHTHDSMHEHSHEHSHSGLGDITGIINRLELPQSVKDHAVGVYQILAAAEAKVHGKPVELVHFHEVGALDAVADIVGFCLLVERLKIEKIIASAPNVGSGQVRTSHGILPVPAPATAQILLGIPTYSDNTAGELLTPTGAALLKCFAQSFGAMPVMKIEKIGYGMGKKNFAAANCVRAFLGELSDQGPNDIITELRCNVDDMTPEAISFATEVIMGNGARDVYIEPVYMKKNRPGFVFVCLCKEEDSEKIAGLLLKHTTTIGVRKFQCERYILDRSVKEVDTSLGRIRIKYSQGYGIIKCKPEFDDVARLAKSQGLAFDEAYQRILSEMK